MAGISWSLAHMAVNHPELALSVTGPVLQIAVSLLIVRRHLVKTFPIFFSYTVFSVVLGISGLFAQGYPTFYFYYYWSTQAGYLLLAFGALYEIVQSLFANLPAMRWINLLFGGFAAAMLVYAGVRNWLAPPPGGHPLFSVIVLLEIAVRILQLGLLFLFFVLARFFRSHWQHYPFGIALGFGIAAGGSLTVFLLRSEFGTKFDSVVRITPPIAYLIAEVVWLVTFVMKPPDRLSGTVSLPNPDQLLADVKRNTESAKEILKR